MADLESGSISPTFRACFFLLEERSRKTTATMTATPPTAPPMTAPITVLDYNLIKITLIAPNNANSLF